MSQPAASVTQCQSHIYGYCHTHKVLSLAHKRSAARRHQLSASARSPRLPVSYRPRRSSQASETLRPLRASTSEDHRAANQSASGASENRWEETSEAAWVLGVFVGVLVLGQLSTALKLPYLDLPYFVFLASLTIYIAAHRSRSNSTRQQISLTQGALAPLGASAALLGGYIIIKFLPQLSLQIFFNAYFFLLGSIAVAGGVAPLLRRLVGLAGVKDGRLKLPRGVAKDEAGRDLADIGIGASDVAALVLGLGAAGLDLWWGHTNFTLNNLLACLIACDILGLIGLSSFRTAVVLLMGLLAYDVFWVFGSPKVIGDNVMLTVATSEVLTGPVRLLFPRPIGTGEAKNFPFALLGLGDIAVPGLLAGLALRYDSARHLDGNSQSKLASVPVEEQTSLPPLPQTARTSADGGTRNRSDVYFWACMGAYLAGLLCAFTASTVTHLGQPALLYIVPFMLGAVGGTALIQGELRQVVEFTEKPTASPFANLDKHKD